MLRAACESLLPLLNDSQATWADRTLFIHQGRWEKGDNPDDSKFKNCAVRTQRWRFVNNSQLYDISNDPFEEKNVAEEHPEVISELRKAYDLWWAETLPLMVNEDAPYAEAQPQAVRYQKQLDSIGIPRWPTKLGE